MRLILLLAVLGLITISCGSSETIDETQKEEAAASDKTTDDAPDKEEEKE